MPLACRIQQASDGTLDLVILAFAGVAEDDVTVLVSWYSARVCSPKLAIRFPAVLRTSGSVR